jgi:TRAP-type C4-dicarboxylate transport system, periplasmic component
VDAEENPLKSIYDYKFFEVAPFITMTEHFYSTVNLIINMNVWKSLSPKDQTIMEKAASEATIYQRERCAIREKEAKELMLKKGVTIFDKVDKNAWEKAMSPVYKDKKLVEKYGYWLEKIKKYSGK